MNVSSHKLKMNCNTWNKAVTACSKVLYQHKLGGVKHRMSNLEYPEHDDGAC